MKIRPIGRDFEATGSGCGEVMLVMEGDSVNFRMGPPVDIGGVSIPMPQAVLCVACHRKENSSADLSIKFVSLYCTGCGRTLTPEDDFEPEVDEDGDLKRIVCSDCLEPWRTGSCEAN